jgi:hypothetical protein
MYSCTSTLKVTFYTGSGRQPHLTELTIRYKYLRARIMARKYGVTGPQIKGPIAVRARTVYSTKSNCAELGQLANEPAIPI